MPIANGVYKKVIYKKQAGAGTMASASGAQLLRRVSSTLDLVKQTYQSNEIREDMQISDFRHGVRTVSGKISGELSPRTYADFFAAVLRRQWSLLAPTTGLSLTIAGSGPTYTLTRASGSFLTDGYKIGEVIRISAGSVNAANLNKNLMIVGLTATVATVIVLNGTAMVAEGPIASTTVMSAGKKTYVPTTGHTDDYFSIEHVYPDFSTAQSEIFTDLKITQTTVDLPPTGIATVSFDLSGKDVTTQTGQYFSSPTAVNTFGNLAAVNGVARINGVTMATVTGLNISIKTAHGGDPVVGQNTIPQQFAGDVVISGQFTAYFDGVTLRDAFIAETEIDLYVAFTADNTANSDYIAISLPRIKLGNASKSDGKNGIVQTFPFQALLNNAGGTGIATEKTTILIQDSQAV